MINLSRRNAIKYGGGFLGTGLAATVLGSNLVKPEPVAAQNPIIAQNKDITPDQALRKLMEGNKRFVEQKRQTPNQTRERLVEVSESQAPFASILGCADSRVPAEIVFDQGLGDLFVCRIAGNIAIAEEVGSLEFGSMVLGSKVLMVLGHSRCGAVEATIKGGRFPGQIGTLIDDIQVGVERAQQQSGTNKLEMAIQANVIHQVELLNQSVVLGDLIDKNQLKIVGGYYDLETGEVTLLT
ncbi:carbonic anhydrase [Gloeothece citriformis]|uniref:carbonic anhydrase n=1 Tax=Gloeothece citriformis TaxID=2546356 RepID=UPI00059B721F